MADPDAGSEAPTQGRAPGSLTVSIEGLPEGVGGRVAVLGPDGFRRTLQAGATLTGVPEGDYRIDALDVGAGGQSWTPATRERELELDGAGATVDVRYEELEPVIAEGTVAIQSDDEAARALEGTEFVEVDEAAGALVETFTFDPVPPRLEDLEVGQYLSLGLTEQTPYGYLGEVRELQRHGDRLVVTAGTVPIEEVVEQGGGSAGFVADTARMDEAVSHVEGMSLIAPDDPRVADEAQRLQARIRAQHANVEPLQPQGLAPQNDDSITQSPVCISLDDVTFLDDEDATLTGSGELCVGVGGTVGLNLEDGAYFEAGALQEGSLELEGEGEISLDVMRQIPGLVIPMGVIAIPIGPVVIGIAPVLTFNVELGGSIEGDFHLSVEQHLELTGGASIHVDGVDTFGTSDAGIDFDSAGTLEGFSVMAGVGPQVGAYFYGIYGPNAALTPYLEYAAMFEEDPWWTLDLGARGYLGANLNGSGTYVQEVLKRVLPELFRGQEDILMDTVLGILSVLDFQYEIFDLSWRIAEAPPGQEPILVDVAPQDVEMAACEVGTFTATLDGDDDDAVTWRTEAVETDRPHLDDAGTVRGGGREVRYTAPFYPGTYELIAASEAQPGQRHAATVTVEEGSPYIFVRVAGVPDGVDANVTLRGPDGYARTITEDTDLSCLAPGAYTLEVGSVTDPDPPFDIVKDGFLVTPTVTVDTGDVSTSVGPAASIRHDFDQPASVNSSIVVQYQDLLATAQVRVDGLPDADLAEVTLTGPFGTERTKTGEAFFPVLSPGEYRLHVPAVEANGFVYEADPERLPGDTVAEGDGVTKVLTLEGGAGTTDLDLAYVAPDAPALFDFALDTDALDADGGPVKATWDARNVETFELDVARVGGGSVDGVTVNGDPYFDPHVLAGGADGATVTLPPADGPVSRRFDVRVTALGPDGDADGVAPTASAGVNVAGATQGALDLRVNAPAEADGVDVRVLGPDGFDEEIVTADAHAWGAVAPGTYLVEARDVPGTSGDVRYGVRPRTRLVQVDAGGEAEAVVGYQARSGALDVNVDGSALPPDVTPDVTVYGPAGFRHRLTAPGPRAFEDVVPGTYTLVADAVEGPNASYRADGAEVTVDGGATEAVTVTYGTDAGALRLAADLPAGVEADVRLVVDGPRATSVEVPFRGAATLRDVPAGTYEVTAAPVQAGGVTFETTGPAFAEVLPGASQDATVELAAVTGDLAVDLEAVPPGAAPLVKVEATSGDFQADVGADATLTGLAAGTYDVSTTGFSVAPYDYDATAAADLGAEVAEVIGGERTTVHVPFEPVTGAIELAVVAAADVNPDVTVEGPDGYAHHLDAAGVHTLTFLTEGSYTLSATDDGTTEAVVDPSTLNVAAGVTANASVSYDDTVGVITLASNLAPGVPAALTPRYTLHVGDNVDDPAQRTLTRDAGTWSGVPEGTYAVRAHPRTVDAMRFEATHDGGGGDAVSFDLAGGGEETLDFTYAPASGALDVHLDGLPAGVDPGATLAGDGRTYAVPAGGGTVADVLPGDYTLTAQRVEADGITHAPQSEPDVHVDAGVRDARTVTYAPVDGKLRLDAEGVPDGLRPTFALSGDGAPDTVAAGEVVTGLSGTVTVTPQEVTTSSGTTYDHEASLDVAIDAGATTVRSVPYERVTGTVEVTVTGRPDGQRLNVWLEAIDGDAYESEQDVAESVAFPGLAAGTEFEVDGVVDASGFYDVTAEPATLVVEPRTQAVTLEVTPREPEVRFDVDSDWDLGPLGDRAATWRDLALDATLDNAVRYELDVSSSDGVVDLGGLPPRTGEGNQLGEVELDADLAVGPNTTGADRTYTLTLTAYGVEGTTPAVATQTLAQDAMLERVPFDANGTTQWRDAHLTGDGEYRFVGYELGGAYGNNLFATEVGAGAVDVTSFPDGSGTTALDFPPFNRFDAWIAQRRAGEVLHFDMATGTALERYITGSRPRDVFATQDMGTWVVSEGGGSAWLERFQHGERRDAFELSGAPRTIAPGPGFAFLWIVDWRAEAAGGEPALLRVTVSDAMGGTPGEVEAFPFPAEAVGPTDVVQAGGVYWIHDPGFEGLFRFDPSDPAAGFETVALEAKPNDVTAIGDTLWVALRNRNSLLRLPTGDPDAAVEFVYPGTSPAALAGNAYRTDRPLAFVDRRREEVVWVHLD